MAAGDQGRKALPVLLRRPGLSDLDVRRAVGPCEGSEPGVYTYGVELAEREATMTPLGVSRGRTAFTFDWKAVRDLPRSSALLRQVRECLLSLGIYRAFGWGSTASANPELPESVAFVIRMAKLIGRAL